MLEIQKYLATNTPESLKEKYGIAVRRHAKYPNLVLFKYSMIDSPMDEPIVQESRGLILDENDNWEVACYTYRKFFNSAESRAASIDWSSAKVLEKADGSLCQLYYYDGAWQISSSGIPDAGGEVQGFGLSFAELFWQVWKELGYQLPPISHSDYCFAFELMTPFNKIVVQHKKNRIVLHGVRDLQTLEEKDPSPMFADLGYEMIKSFPLATLEDVLATCDSIKPDEGEGYVVVDKNFNRIKIKTKEYVRLARIRDCMSARRMLEIVRDGESTEFLAYFQEYQALHDKVLEAYNSFIANIESTYDLYKHIENQKEFALSVKDLPYNGFYFGLRQNRSVKQQMASMPVKNLQVTLKLKDVNLLAVE